MDKISLFLVYLVCLFSVNAAHAAKIYKWVGPDGQVHYSSTPPAEVDAQSTGIKTTPTKKPSGEDSDSKTSDGGEALTDEERIRRLEEKIRELEEKDAASKSSDHTEKSEEDVPEEDKQPDYSVQGQIRMLEEENRHQRMMTRCRAKAPHGTDCSKSENYEKY